MRLLKLGLYGVFVAFLAGGCATTGNNPQEKREAVQTMRAETLADLYQYRPAVKAKLEAAPGYAVFSSANVNLGVASFSGGYGVVVDNESKKATYMKMGEAGVGLGLGIKDFRAVFIFHDRTIMNRFINSGWELGGHADAAAKAGDAGGAVAGELLLDGITIYQMTKAGLALQLTIKGTRYWKDDELN